MLRERLWIRAGDFYHFNQWSEWNSDEHPKTTAAKLVGEILTDSHPISVRMKLGNEAAKLLEEGVEYSIVKAALRLWLGKANAAPSWLPMLVSDVIRKGGSGERDSALREAWKTGDTRPLVKFGLVFTPPDLPREITTVPDAKAWMLKRKQLWVEQVRKEL